MSDREKRINYDPFNDTIDGVPVSENLKQSLEQFRALGINHAAELEKAVFRELELTRQTNDHPR